MSDAVPPSPRRDAGPIARIARGLAVFGGLVTLGIALFVTSSVLLRWTTGFGIRGDFELVQVATAVAIFAFLPLCQFDRGNIFVDTFTKGLPPAVTSAIDALWDLLYAAFALFIAWRLSVGALESRAAGTNSMVLQLPQWPAIGLASLFMAVLGVVALATAWRMVVHRR